MENLRNDVCEAIVKMEANKTGGEVSKQTFVNYCNGNCIKGFDHIIFEIIRLDEQGNAGYLPAFFFFGLTACNLVTVFFCFSDSGVTSSTVTSPGPCVW